MYVRVTRDFVAEEGHVEYTGEVVLVDLAFYFELDAVGATEMDAK